MGVKPILCVRFLFCPAASSRQQRSCECVQL